MQKTNTHLAATSLRRFLFLSIVFVVMLMVRPGMARADSIVLTGGTTSVQGTLGQVSVALGGNGFSLNYFNPDYAGPVTGSFAFQSITQGIGTVTLNGQSSQFFTGSLSFSNSLLTGQLTAFQTLSDSVNQNPLFTVTFSGAGVQTFGPGFRSFQVVPTPEPTSFALLLMGLGGCVGKVLRKRRK
jgi:hypothetical protein